MSKRESCLPSQQVVVSPCLLLASPADTPSLLPSPSAAAVAAAFVCSFEIGLECEDFKSVDRKRQKEAVLDLKETPNLVRSKQTFKIASKITF